MKTGTVIGTGIGISTLLLAATLLQNTGPLAGLDLLITVVAAVIIGLHMACAGLVALLALFALYAGIEAVLGRAK